MTPSRPTTPITFARSPVAAGGDPLAALTGAKRAGVTGVESAVRRSADGHPVLLSERAVRRGWRRHRVDRTAAADLSPLGVPRLADLYEAVGTDLHVRLDLSDPGAGAAALDVARSTAGVALERLWLTSPDLDVLRGLRRVDDRVRLVHSGSPTSVDESLERHAYTLSEERIDAFSMDRRAWSTGLVVLFHRFDVLAFASETREVRHLREVLSYDVDAVSCEHPDRMVATVAEWTEGDAGGAAAG